MLGIHLLLAVIAWESQDQLIPPVLPDRQYFVVNVARGDLHHMT